MFPLPLDNIEALYFHDSNSSAATAAVTEGGPTFYRWLFSFPLLI